MVTAGVGLAVIVALIAALALLSRQAGRDAAEGDQARDTIDAIEEGTDAANAEERATRGLDDDAVRDRLLRREW